MMTDSQHSDADHIHEFIDRWEYTRPNFLTLSNNQGRYFDGGTYRSWLPEGTEGSDFIFVSDHNRSSAPLTVDRIGANKRMINANMRTYHIADKVNLPLSWTDLPSRAYSSLDGYPAWKDDQTLDKDQRSICKFTADGAAGGVEMLDWHQRHPGSFWVFLNYDSNANSGQPDALTTKSYSKVFEMIVTDFSYDITRRSHGHYVGNTMYAVDLWDVSMTLEQV